MKNHTMKSLTMKNLHVGSVIFKSKGLIKYQPNFNNTVSIEKTDNDIINEESVYKIQDIKDDYIINKSDNGENYAIDTSVSKKGFEGSSIMNENMDCSQENDAAVDGLFSLIKDDHPEKSMDETENQVLTQRNNKHYHIFNLKAPNNDSSFKKVLKASCILTTDNSMYSASNSKMNDRHCKINNISKNNLNIYSQNCSSFFNKSKVNKTSVTQEQLTTEIALGVESTLNQFYSQAINGNLIENLMGVDENKINNNVFTKEFMKHIVVSSEKNFLAGPQQNTRLSLGKHYQMATNYSTVDNQHNGFGYDAELANHKVSPYKAQQATYSSPRNQYTLNTKESSNAFTNDFLSSRLQNKVKKNGLQTFDQNMNGEQTDDENITSKANIKDINSNKSLSNREILVETNNSKKSIMMKKHCQLSGKEINPEGAMTEGQFVMGSVKSNPSRTVSGSQPPISNRSVKDNMDSKRSLGSKLQLNQNSIDTGQISQKNVNEPETTELEDKVKAWDKKMAKIYEQARGSTKDNSKLQKFNNLNIFKKGFWSNTPKANYSSRPCFPENIYTTEPINEKMINSVKRGNPKQIQKQSKQGQKLHRYRKQFNEALLWRKDMFVEINPIGKQSMEDIRGGNEDLEGFLEEIEGYLSPERRNLHKLKLQENIRKGKLVEIASKNQMNYHRDEIERGNSQKRYNSEGCGSISEMDNDFDQKIINGEIKNTKLDIRKENKKNCKRNSGILPTIPNFANVHAEFNDPIFRPNIYQNKNEIQYGNQYNRPLPLNKKNTKKRNSQVVIGKDDDIRNANFKLTLDPYSIRPPRNITTVWGKVYYVSYWIRCIDKILDLDYEFDILTCPPIGYYNIVDGMPSTSSFYEDSYVLGGEFEKYESDQDFRDRERLFNTMNILAGRVEYDINHDNNTLDTHLEVEYCADDSCSTEF